MPRTDGSDLFDVDNVVRGATRTQCQMDRVLFGRWALGHSGDSNEWLLKAYLRLKAT